MRTTMLVFGVICLPIICLSEPPRIDQSSIKYVANPSVGNFVCKGIDSKKIDLSSIGISNELYIAGIPCTTGDYDGNGYLDFAFYNPNPSSWPLNQDENVLVYFFKGPKIIGKSSFPQQAKEPTRGVCESSRVKDAIFVNNGADTVHWWCYDEIGKKWVDHSYMPPEGG